MFKILHCVKCGYKTSNEKGIFLKILANNRHAIVGCCDECGILKHRFVKSKLYTRLLDCNDGELLDDIGAKIWKSIASIRRDETKLRESEQTSNITSTTESVEFPSQPTEPSSIGGSDGPGEVLGLPIGGSNVIFTQPVPTIGGRSDSDKQPNTT